MSFKSNVREQTARVLALVIKGQSLATAMPVAEKRINPRDLSLLRQLCYGTLRHWFSLTAIRDSLLSKPIKERETEIQALLLIGLYQILYTRIPEHAALSETVGSTSLLKKPWAKGLVNAVLRNAQRSKNKLIDNLPELAQSEHPEWLLEQLKEAWPEHWQDITAANNQKAPMTLRVNALKTSRSNYLKSLKEKRISGRRSIHSPVGITLEEAQNVTDLPGFEEGLFSVQDEAAQLSSKLMECQPGERVLDACAAPGGKTCHLLESTADLNLTAVDLEENRLVRVKENLKRLNLKKTIVVQGDVSEKGTWWDGQLFDRILLDAPCSATGVIRRHPDIKLLRRPEDIENLAELQAKIIDNLWGLLKPGGTMVYATCSILPQENAQQMESFLSRHSDAEETTPEVAWGEKVSHGKQLIPQPDGHDGFYYCRLKKMQTD